MKTALIFTVLLFPLCQCYAQTSVPAAEAAKHVGEKITVCDKVFGGRFLENAKDQPTLINMGDAYPNNPFTFVIFGDNRKKFSYAPEEFLLNKQVCVTGEISSYHDKPQIIVMDSTQLKIK